MTRTVKYLDYTITRMFTSPYMLWQFVANDFDGAVDSKDYRCGHGRTVEDCLDQIDFYISEEAFEDQEREARRVVLRSLKRYARARR